MKRSPTVYRWSSIGWGQPKGIESAYAPVVWCHPVYSEGDGGVKLVFGSFSEFEEFVNTLNGSLVESRRKLAKKSGNRPRKGC